MDGAVFVLSALTSFACAGLLLRSFADARARLLFWAGLCFLGLGLNNVLLFVDKIVIPEDDLSAWRGLPALAGLFALAYGLLAEER